MHMKACGVITLLTDFGLSDPYAGIMKGVISSINQEARIIDITHQIKQGAVTHAAWLIQEFYPFFPKGTIHIAVVDPGVGSKRRAILIRTGDYFFVGPDNGIFWPIIKHHEEITIIHLTERRYFSGNISSTFHGRDIFAPVAAHLSLGTDPMSMGSPINNPAPIDIPEIEQTGKMIRGRVIRVDHFGNIITNIHRTLLEGLSGTSQKVIKIAGLKIMGISNTYSDVKKGELLALVGSSDFLEIAVNSGRPCDMIGITQEDIIGIEVKVVEP